MSKNFISVEDFSNNLDKFRIPLSALERAKIPGKNPYYGAAKIIDYVDGFTHSGLSVLIAEDGSVETEKGYPVVQLADGEYWVNNHTHVLKGENDLDTEYLYYALQTVKISPFVTGAVQKKISQKELNSMLIPYFESKEHRNHIVNILRVFDQKIQLNTQTNQTLEHIAQTIYKSWFIDYEPTRAKAAVLAAGGSKAEAESAAMTAISGKSAAELAALKQQHPTRYQQLADLAAAFPAALVPTDDFGEIPAGWEVKKVGDIVKVVKGKSYKSSELAPSRTALVTLKSFNRGGGYRLDGLKEYTGTYKSEQEVFAGDLIIAYTDVTQAADVIGKPAMVMSDNRYEHLVISLDVGVVRPKNATYKYFLYCMAMTESFQAHTQSFCTGTTVLHLGKDAVPSFKIAIPDEFLLRKFSDISNPIFAAINRNIEQGKELEKIRDTLLPKLLSGEVLP